jgi:sec-independent protein translocase protein TatA
MGSFSIWHWIIVGAIVLVLFGGKGKISDLMGDFAKGIKSFKKGLSEDEEKPAEKPADPAVARTLDHAPAKPAEAAPAAEPRKVG